MYIYRERERESARALIDIIIKNNRSQNKMGEFRHALIKQYILYLKNI